MRQLLCHKHTHSTTATAAAPFETRLELVAICLGFPLAKRFVQAAEVQQLHVFVRGEQLPQLCITGICGDAHHLHQRAVGKAENMQSQQAAGQANEG